MIDLKSPVSHASRITTCDSHRSAVERVVALLRKEPAENLSLEEMAQQAFLSPFHFNRVFRQLTGIPPGQFHSALRLQAAKKLLLETGMSVFDVCFEVGYKSPSTFVRRFTDLVGVSPYQWRSQAGPAAALLSELGGLVFAGLFPRAIPQGSPIACAVLSQPGRCELPSVPDGDYFLFAAALPTTPAPAAGLLCGDELLRSGVRGERIRVREGRSARVELALRSPEPIDPPILLAFPVLATSGALSPADLGRSDVADRD
jgi:AraC family transcriptional regulator